MKITVIFNDQGFPVMRAAAPPDNHIIMEEPGAFQDAEGRWLQPDGSYKHNLRGHGCYGGPDGRTITTVPDDAALIGKSWDDLAALKSTGHPYGLLQSPRPETTAERRARETAEAEAAATAEAARIAALKITRRQCALALLQMQVISDNEALAMITTATPPGPVEALITALPQAQQMQARLDFTDDQYARSNTLINGLLQAAGKTTADADAFFVAASTL